MEPALSDTEKLKIATDFLLQSPPGEFNEVFNDVRLLLDNDNILKEGVMKVIAKYNMEHFVPCKIDEKNTCLITPYSDQGNGKYIDPKSKKIFSFDHLKRQASSFSESKVCPDQGDEKWRIAFEKDYEVYTKDFYPNASTSVYSLQHNSPGMDGNVRVLVCCLEDHNFNPKNYWNGRWRSCWVANFHKDGKSGELKGVFKIIVHYYEDGNVQLLAKKEVKKPFNITDPEGTAKDIFKIISQEEHFYQTSLSDCYQNMSETTFKALRRQLPITRTKIDWEKITAYKLASEMKGGIR
ncbi:unnamed protein product [Gordionus sp. m RMFG-2023]|uniref:F-actin-capping protein subunit alpha-2-like n=1 Tax=Gordionus sp. m RMFG-2023 TaxID=3053472 RepID=UPI0030E3E034